MKSIRWILTGCLLTCFALLASSCDDAKQCEINSDCPEGQYCDSGECRIECREQRDCNQGEVCQAGRCMPLMGNSCTDDGDCRNGEFCLNGLCQIGDASQDQGGDEGQDTTDTQPDLPQDTGQDTPTDTGQDTPTDQNVDMGTDTPVDMGSDTGTDMGMDMGMDMVMDMSSCPPRNGQYFEPCACAAQCATGLCVGNPLSGSGVCSQSCMGRANCNGGNDICGLVDDGMGGTAAVCLPDETGVLACTSNADCFFGRCIEAAGTSVTPTNYCAIPCTNAGDCKPGWACSPVICASGNLPNLPGCIYAASFFGQSLAYEQQQLAIYSDFSQKLCTPMGQQNNCQTNADGELCHSALCLDRGSPGASACTSECSNALDCPIGSTECLLNAGSTNTGLPINACLF